MLFPQDVLARIAAGEVTLAFRRWDRARVKAGSRLRTAVGLVAVESIEVVHRFTNADARRAGYADRAALLAALDRYGSGNTYRIALRHVGADPRIALRSHADLADAELTDLKRRLASMDRHRQWTVQVLRLIADKPGARAADLAAELGREKLPFKADVRKLKELGLTESLEVGYRLSPRGEVVLAALTG